MKRYAIPFALAAVVLVLAMVGPFILGEPEGLNPEATETGSGEGPPTFRVDAGWPHPLPDNQILGTVTGVAVDDRDHVWVAHATDLQGPRELGAIQDPPISECCYPAPPILEFGPDGELLRTWDGDGEGFQWPEVPHGTFVDHNGHLWVGSIEGHHQVLKFTQSGEHLLSIGRYEETGGSHDPELLGGPADVWVDPETNEAFIADGYGNRRVVVYDGETGEYLRHWGAYGEEPDDEYEHPERGPDAEPSRQFGTVHGIVGSRDGLLYVADRTNNRVQVFEQDGTFVAEAFARPETLGSGSAFDVALSEDPEQTFLYLADGTNQKIWIFRRSDLEVVGEFGQGGRQAGHFLRPHMLDVDSQGNLYVGEVDNERVQKFTPERSP